LAANRRRSHFFAIRLLGSGANENLPAWIWGATRERDPDAPRLQAETVSLRDEFTRADSAELRLIVYKFNDGRGRRAAAVKTLELAAA
jgi:hypothetical protein